ERHDARAVHQHERSLPAETAQVCSPLAWTRSVRRIRIRVAGALDHPGLFENLTQAGRTLVIDHYGVDDVCRAGRLVAVARRARTGHCDFLEVCSSRWCVLSQ